MSRTALLFRVGGDLHRVEGRKAVLGRSRECDVRCDRQGVSRRHCEVHIDDDGVLVKDLDSRHGTWIRGRPVTGGKRIRIGTKLSLGKVGPKLELAGALLEGRKLRPDGRGFLEAASESMAGSTRPVTSTASAARPATTPVSPLGQTAPTIGLDGPGGPVLPPHPSSPPQPTMDTPFGGSTGGSESQFLRFAVIGFVIGAVLGVAAVAIVDVRPMIDSVRDAVGM